MIIIFQFDPNAKKQDLLTKQWIAFCNFHLGNYKQALDDYVELKKNDSLDGKAIDLNIAVCMFYLGNERKFVILKSHENKILKNTHIFYSNVRRSSRNY